MNDLIDSNGSWVKVAHYEEIYPIAYWYTYCVDVWNNMWLRSQKTC